MPRPKGVTTLDDKYRLAIGCDAARASGLRKGEKLVVVPFRGGFIVESSRGRKFSESLRGFAFKEEKHEASSYLKTVIKTAGA
ncbi:MAG: hypothetical protein LYZ69_08275 [Nitrososphaerales archaeon]|nr:hypothetical protein [Nitrososphaerales archaeon]